jgi:hypothetical protein
MDEAKSATLGNKKRGKVGDRKESGDNRVPGARYKVAGPLSKHLSYQHTATCQPPS